MRTIRITLCGGPHCGTDLHIERHLIKVEHKGITYIRSPRRDAENRQVFVARHNRTLPGLRVMELD